MNSPIVVIPMAGCCLTFDRTVARAKQLEHEERAHLRPGRNSVSSARPSFEPARTPALGYTDVDSDDEEAHEIDPRAVQVASFVGALVEGDPLEEAGLLSEDDLRYDSDLDDDAEEQDEATARLLDVEMRNTADLEGR